MDPINRLNRLLEALRLRQQETASTGRAQRAGASAPRGETQRGGHAPTSTRPDLDQLNRRIGERIRLLAPEDRRGTKAAQVFVDSVLAWEFGDELLRSESFSRYSREIQATMSSDPRLKARFQALLDALAG